jgi:hypothetical protein
MAIAAAAPKMCSTARMLNVKRKPPTTLKTPELTRANGARHIYAVMIELLQTTVQRLKRGPVPRSSSQNLGGGKRLGENKF